jgi:hypothetical protein
MKKTRKVKKLSLKNLKVSVLEARESPQGAGICYTSGTSRCGGSIFDGNLVGLDAPPEFQAQGGGLLQPNKSCTYNMLPAPNDPCLI